MRDTSERMLNWEAVARTPCPKKHFVNLDFESMKKIMISNGILGFRLGAIIQGEKFAIALPRTIGDLSKALVSIISVGLFGLGCLSIVPKTLDINSQLFLTTVMSCLSTFAFRAAIRPGFRLLGFDYYKGKLE